MTRNATHRWILGTALLFPVLAARIAAGSGEGVRLADALGRGFLDGVTLLTMISCGICLGAGAAILTSGTGAIVGFLSGSASIAKMGACVGTCAAVVGL